jgi:hypothetical protein
MLFFMGFCNASVWLTLQPEILLCGAKIVLEFCEDLFVEACHAMQGQVGLLVLSESEEFLVGLVSSKQHAYLPR